MARALLSLLLLLALRAAAAETVRIAMGELRGQVSLSGPGLESGPDVEEPSPSDWTPVVYNRSLIRSGPEGLSIDGRKAPGSTLRFHTAQADGRLSAGEWTVRGDLVVRKLGDRLQLINVLSLEDYLAGVLGAEMPARFPVEALKAQAIAARTYAVQRKIDAYGQPFHLGSSVLNQVYQGLRQEDPRTHAAIDATRGEILTYQMAPIEAYFHASCGGRTESGKQALQRDLPYLQSVDCPCGELSQSHWKLSLSPQEMRELEGEATDTRPGIEVVSRSPTGRALLLRLGRRVLDAVSFRKKLGYSRVKSLDFEVDNSAHEPHLTGKGFGHGAGLCQLGARLFAERGWTYRQILAHYYPGAELQQLY